MNYVGGWAVKLWSRIVAAIWLLVGPIDLRDKWRLDESSQAIELYKDRSR